MREHGLGPMDSTRSHKDLTFSPDGRYKETRKHFPWKKDVHGQKALCHIACFLRELDTEDRWVHSKPSDLGVSGESLRLMLQHHYPIIFRRYYDVTGKPLTNSILMGRLGNMFRDNRTKTFCLGPEHPKQHPSLSIVLDKVWIERKQKKAELGIG